MKLLDKKKIVTFGILISITFSNFRELETQLLEQCTVDTGAAKGQSLPSVMGNVLFKSGLYSSCF